MKLFYSASSPYSRKVRLVVLEKGMQHQVELMLCNPFEDALTTVEAEVNDLGDTVTLAHLAFATALGYLEFRLPELGWRNNCPATAAWYDIFRTRASMCETQPV